MRELHARRDGFDLGNESFGARPEPALAEQVDRFRIVSHGVLDTPRSELLHFLTCGDVLAVPHRLAAMPPKAEPFYSTPAADRVISSFINQLDARTRVECFKQKLFDHARGATFESALARTLGLPRAEAGALELTDVKDFSTGRALIAGHFVYRLTLEDRSGTAHVVFLKGTARADIAELKKFPGWERRPGMHRYDTFFQELARDLGMSSYRSTLVGERFDRNVRAMVLSQEIRGEMSDGLFTGESPLSAELQLRPLGPAAQGLLGQLARWHALSDLFGKTDTRLRRTSRLGRSGNFIISGDPAAPRLESLDHEFLFATPECDAYHQQGHLTALEALSLIPTYARGQVIDGYRAAYGQAWRELTRPEQLRELLLRTAREFGPLSTEARELVRRSAFDGDAWIDHQLQVRFATAPRPVEACEHGLARMARCFGATLFTHLHERGGLDDWEQQAASIGQKLPGRLSMFAARAIYDRMAALEQLGMRTQACVREPLQDFLKHGMRRPASAAGEEKFFVMLENRRAPGTIVRQIADWDTLCALAVATRHAVPDGGWTITVLPWRKIDLHGNVTVHADGSVRGEFVLKSDGPPSRGAYRQELTFETPRFMSRFPRVNSEDPLFLETVRQVMATLPRRALPDGSGEELVPGYYEVAAARREGVKHGRRELLYIDYWDV